MKYRDYINEMFGEPHPLAGEVLKFEGELSGKYPQIKEIGLYMAADKSLYLSDIQIRPQFRGQGWGTKIMTDIVDFADRHGLVMTLMPEPERGSVGRLINFYKKFGFIENRGRRARHDLGGSAGLFMYRLPKAVSKV